MNYSGGLRLAFRFGAALVFFSLMSSLPAASAPHIGIGSKAAIEAGTDLIQIASNGRKIRSSGRSFRRGYSVQRRRSFSGGRRFRRHNAVRGPVFRHDGTIYVRPIARGGGYRGVIGGRGRTLKRKSLRVSTPLRVRVGEDRPVLRRGGKAHRDAKWYRVQVNPSPGYDLRSERSNLGRVSNRFDRDRRHRRPLKTRGLHTLSTAAFGYNYMDYKSYSIAEHLAKQDCAIQFESFDWETGLYTTPEEYKRLCPYLEELSDIAASGAGAAWIIAPTQ